MTACRATVSLEGMLRSAAPAPAAVAKTQATEQAAPSRWRIVAADGSRDACPCPTPKPVRAGDDRSVRRDARADADEYARLAAGLEMMAAVGLSLPEQAKPKLAMPSGAPDMGELLAAASVVVLTPPEPAAAAPVEPNPHTASCRSREPSGACRCQGGELSVAPVVDAWPRLPRDIRAAILAVVSSTLE